MKSRLLMLTTLALLLGGSHAFAQVYKCKRGTGYSYQDSPCPGRMVKRIEVPSTPPAPAAPRTAPVGGGPAVSAAPAMVTMPVAAAAPPPPTSLAPVTAPLGVAPVPPPPKAEAWACTRHDGSRYYSVGRLPRGQNVPAASAPAGAMPGTEGEVFVPDQCVPASRTELCTWYREQAEANRLLQASARGMDLRRAEREGKRLQTLRSHRCGG
ncbi:MAG: DUF4124 domain-containing protein [Xanthomonadales bacterium]|jgi:hypothetical protein|nr:DUF4124 domain-containing protein [Xanthomonadales bacterium]